MIEPYLAENQEKSQNQPVNGLTTLQLASTTNGVGSSPTGTPRRHMRTASADFAPRDNLVLGAEYAEFFGGYGDSARGKAVSSERLILSPHGTTIKTILVEDNSNVFSVPSESVNAELHRKAAEYSASLLASGQGPDGNLPRAGLSSRKTQRSGPSQRIVMVSPRGTTGRRHSLMGNESGKVSWLLGSPKQSAAPDAAATAIDVDSGFAVALQSPPQATTRTSASTTRNRNSSIMKQSGSSTKPANAAAAEHEAAKDHIGASGRLGNFIVRGTAPTPAAAGDVDAVPETSHSRRSSWVAESHIGPAAPSPAGGSIGGDAAALIYDVDEYITSAAIANAGTGPAGMDGYKRQQLRNVDGKSLTQNSDAVTVLMKPDDAATQSKILSGSMTARARLESAEKVRKMKTGAFSHNAESTHFGSGLSIRPDSAQSKPSGRRTSGSVIYTARGSSGDEAGVANGKAVGLTVDTFGNGSGPRPGSQTARPAGRQSTVQFSVAEAMTMEHPPGVQPPIGRAPRDGDMNPAARRGPMQRPGTANPRMGCRAEGVFNAVNGRGTRSLAELVDGRGRGCVMSPVGAQSRQQHFSGRLRKDGLCSPTTRRNSIGNSSNGGGNCAASPSPWTASQDVLIVSQGITTRRGANAGECLPGPNFHLADGSPLPVPIYRPTRRVSLACLSDGVSIGGEHPSRVETPQKRGVKAVPEAVGRRDSVVLAW